MQVWLIAGAAQHLRLQPHSISLLFAMAAAMKAMKAKKATKAVKPVKATNTIWTKKWHTTVLGIHNSWSLSKLEHDRETGVVTETWLGTPRDLCKPSDLGKPSDLKAMKAMKAKK